MCFGIKSQRKKVEFPMRSGTAEKVYFTGDVVVEICQNCRAEAGRRNTLISLSYRLSSLLPVPPTGQREQKLADEEAREISP